MKFVDLFCGIGTIRMGMEQAGHECVYSVEWDKHKRKIYKVVFGNEPEGSDIQECNGRDIPAADIWCFGAPCQDFSIAGKREGLGGDRSSLVREVFRLIKEIEEEHRPKYLLYENVKGMLSSNKGFDFLEILSEMESLGYDRIEYSLLNSKNFGVPQNRERVFTLGHLRNRSTRKVFPIEGSNSKTLKQLIGGAQGNRVYATDGVSCTLASQAGGQGAKTGLYLCKLHKPYIKEEKRFTSMHDAKIRDIDSELAATVTARYHKGIGAHGDNAVLEARVCLTPNREEKRQNGRRFKEPGEPMFTLTKQDVHGVMIKEATKKGYAIAEEGDSINLAFPNSKTRIGRVGKGVAQTLDQSCNQGTLEGMRIRRLTPKETWRLQGIPDYITDKVIDAGISDTQMYRGAGDACTTNVIYEIAKRL